MLAFTSTSNNSSAISTVESKAILSTTLANVAFLPSASFLKAKGHKNDYNTMPCKSHLQSGNRST